MDSINIVLELYRHLINQLDEGKIPVDLRSKNIIGTVQDDPFDHWIEENIKNSLPENFEVFHSGSLTTPDIIIRDKDSGAILGLEIKKLIQKENGADPRGLTIDYNSSLPCGTTLIKMGEETIEIPCYYLFALLSVDGSSIVTLIIMDGDFLNYDFNLHKKAKFANISEYHHGPYGEGSIRHRRMYTYPNPLNWKLVFFHLRHIVVAKKHDLEVAKETSYSSEIIVRDDIYENSFFYLIKDETKADLKNSDLGKIPVLKDVFAECKARQEKERSASLPVIPPMNNE
jgi:hypothetical protein